MGRVVAVGEVMVELSLGQGRLGYAGDTFNTAIYLARLGHDVAYATVLGGDDPFSRGIVELMAREGLDGRLVARADGRLPGLYAIERDPAGERRFFYWRGEAPVRDLAGLADRAALAAAARTADLVYLSAITLAVVGAEGRALLEALIGEARAVALDLNYRAKLWPDAATARAAVERAAPRAAFVSASHEDLEALDLSDAPARWAAGGVEVIRRDRDREVTVLRPGEAPLRIASGPRVTPVDTTGAGDSFNAGYLGARLNGEGPEAAVRAGGRLAAAVIQRVGAVIPRSAMPA